MGFEAISLAADEGTGTFFVGCEAPCVGDVNDSGAVDVKDLLLVLPAYGGNDLLFVISAWGLCD